MIRNGGIRFNTCVNGGGQEFSSVPQGHGDLQKAVTLAL